MGMGPYSAGVSLYLKYQRRVLDHVKHETYTPRKIAEVADDLSIAADELDEFVQALHQMKADGKIDISQNGVVQLPSLAVFKGEITGKFRKTMRGFGFVEPAQPVREGSLFIPADSTGDALSGDVVRVKFSKDRRGGPGGTEGYVGAIVEVLNRKKSSYSGVLTKQGNLWIVQPDGRQMKNAIVVRDAESTRARDGDKVVVDILVYPEGDDLAEGVITKVLGDAGKPEVETQAVIAAYDLPSNEFPEECVEEAREASRSFDEQIAAFVEHGASTLDNRDDLTEEYIITIDPPDAKDYDDAISIRRTDSIQGGGWELGVYIADVAHFIKQDGRLDMEARDRANSCYLPRNVIPMLPEVLSNGICSLQEGVHRFCKAAFMTYDSRGSIRGERVGQVLIKSSKRLTYIEAQALIDGDLNLARKHAKTPPKYTDQLIETLRDMNACAKAIQSRRDRFGMIVLDLPEVNLVYDERGHVIDAEKEDDAFTHKLIEMFMVEANEVAARLFENMGVPLLRRIHPEPPPGDVDNVRKVAMVAGFRIPKNPSREELQGLLKATAGTPAARAVHMAVLRTLSKAEYSPALIGHFALASNAYAHFTSPIRRYADLTVHRALAEYLDRTDNGKHRPRTEVEVRELGEDLRASKGCLDDETLSAIGAHATQREVNAEQAERELRSFLVLQLLANHVGEDYKAVVTNVSPRGIFVQIDKYLADGFVKSEDLPGDVTRDNMTPVWRIDARSGGLVDIRSGRSWNIGDSVMVRIAQVDLTRRQLELTIANDGGRSAGKAKTAHLKKSQMGQLGGGAAPAGGGGGLGGGAYVKGPGDGFGEFDRGGKTGSQKRSQRSKTRDKGKTNYRRDKDK